MLRAWFFRARAFGARYFGKAAVVDTPDLGQTVLSNHGPTGRHISKKKWLEILDEMRREREAVVRPVRKPNKVAAAAVRNAVRIAEDAVEIADAADALRLARMVEDARSVSATLKAFESAALATAKANEAIAFALAVQKAIKEQDEDEVLMMLLAT